MNRYEMVEQDSKVVLRVTCSDELDGAVIDITGCTLVLRFKSGGDDAVERPMTIADAAGGVATYQFAEGELKAPVLEFEVTITKADGTVITSLEPSRLGVRKRLS